MTFTNPRKSSYLYSLSYEQFLQLFTLRGRPTLLPDDIVAEIYNRLEHDSKVDVLTAITPLAFMSRPLHKETQFILSLFDFDDTDEFVEDEVHCSLKAPAMP